MDLSHDRHGNGRDRYDLHPVWSKQMNEHISQKDREAYTKLAHVKTERDLYWMDVLSKQTENDEETIFNIVDDPEVTIDFKYYAMTILYLIRHKRKKS
jgi:hypothetical protein